MMGKGLKILLLDCLEMFPSVIPTCLFSIPIRIKKINSWEFPTKDTVLFLLIFKRITQSIVKSTNGSKLLEITASLTSKTLACMDLTTFQMAQSTSPIWAINRLSPRLKLTIAEILSFTESTVFRKIDKSSFKKICPNNFSLLNNNSPKVTVFYTSFTSQLHLSSKLFTTKLSRADFFSCLPTKTLL